MKWNEKQKKDDSEWKVVEERLKTMPSKMKLGILSNSYDREQLMVQVQEKTEVGRAYVEMQMEFIKWLAKQSKIVNLPDECPDCGKEIRLSKNWYTSDNDNYIGCPVTIWKCSGCKLRFVEVLREVKDG